jgi:hypothetical protein
MKTREPGGGDSRDGNTPMPTPRDTYLPDRPFDTLKVCRNRRF